MQELRFKITNTETSNIEIVPVSDGVEIIVHYGSKQPFGNNKNSNVEILKNFCSKMKQEEDVDLKQLKSFYKFYENRAQEWKGTLDPEKLFDKWMDKAFKD